MSFQHKISMTKFDNHKMQNTCYCFVPKYDTNLEFTYTKLF